MPGPPCAPESHVATIRHPRPWPAPGAGRQPPRPCTMPSAHPGFCPKPVLPAWVQPGDKNPCPLGPMGQQRRGGGGAASLRLGVKRAHWKISARPPWPTKSASLRPMELKLAGQVWGKPGPLPTSCLQRPPQGRQSNRGVSVSTWDVSSSSPWGIWLSPQSRSLQRCRWLPAASRRASLHPSLGKDARMLSSCPAIQAVKPHWRKPLGELAT